MQSMKALSPPPFSHARAKKGSTMFALLGFVALVVLLRVLWAVVHLLRAVPRRNADFALE
jgi:hypothetical protein